MAVDEFAPPDAPDVPKQAVANGSLRDHLTQLHDRIAREKVSEFTLPVEGDWHGALGIVYRFPDNGAEPLWEAQAKWLETGRLKLTLDGALDVILAAGREVVGRKPGEEWSQPMERPMTFGPELAEFLGVDIEGIKGASRLLCRHLFSPAAVETGVFEGDLALGEHAAEVMGRFRLGHEDAGETFRGE